MAGLRNPLSSMDRSSRRRVQLVRVVQFNNLHRIKIRCGLLGKSHSQDGGNSKIGGDQHAHTLVRIAPFLHLLQALLRKTSGSYHAGNAVVDAKFQAVHHHTRRGEIHHDLGFIIHKKLEAIIAIHLGHHFKIISGVHPLNHSLAYLALRPEHTNPDH